MSYICVPKMEHDQYNFLSFWNIFCTFIPLTTWKIQTFENIKTSHGYIIILHMCTIRYGVWQWYFLKFWTVFCPFTYTHTPLHSCPTPNNTEKKIMKKWKNTMRYYHFTHVYYKWQSYDVWFLRYEVQQTEIFVILDHFLPLTQNFLKNSKTCLEMALYTSVPKIMIICYTVPVIQHVTDVIFIFQFVLIFTFYHPNNPKNQIFEKWKKCCGIYHQFTHVYQKL